MRVRIIEEIHAKVDVHDKERENGCRNHVKINHEMVTHIKLAEVKVSEDDHINGKVEDDDDVEDITLSYVHANGIRHRIAKAGRCSPSSTLVMFLHGWPDFWFTWRHQLVACARNGFLAVAPDMRGCGRTDDPVDVEQFNVHTLAGDVIGIMNALGYDQCLLVGHDWGAWLAWFVALLYPQNIAAVCALSVPYNRHRPKGLLTHLKGKYGNCIDGTSQQMIECKFNYMLHHNLHLSAQEYDKNTREALYRIYFYHDGVQSSSDTPEVKSDKMFILPKKEVEIISSNDNCHVRFDATTSPGLWARLARPKTLPTWITDVEFNHCVNGFLKSGFAGGLRWYQTLDLNWQITRYLNGSKVKQPSLFIAGVNDMVVKTYGGSASCERALTDSCPALTRCVFLTGAGHWVHQERADDVNSILIQFLQSQPKVKPFLTWNSRL